MRRARIQHQFTEFVPSVLEDGILYVSITYGTAVHLCACGCGNKSVTPISPADWKLIFDGDSVSLSPSIGNWQFPCQSHYWIRSGRIDWSTKWTRKQIEAGRRRDERDQLAYFDNAEVEGDHPSPHASDVDMGLLGRVRRILRLGRKAG